jgi:hypothetical protein
LTNRRLAPVAAPTAVERWRAVSWPPKEVPKPGERLPADREVIGVDPGEVQSGVVTRAGGDCLAHVVVECARELRTTDSKTVAPPAPYVEAVLDAIAAQAYTSEKRTGRLPVLAIEGLRAPSGHVRQINPRSLIATGFVLGAVLGRFVHGPEGAFVWVVIVPPGENGSAPLAAYPRSLIGPRENARGLRIGTGRLRHARSAFDVAGAARHPTFTSSRRYDPIGPETVG